MQHITYDATNTKEVWDNTLMMTVIPLTKIGKLLVRPHHVEEAKRQFLLHVQYLYDSSTGLWFRGWKFDDGQPGQLGHNFARARRARGNSWITIAIPEFIELLDLQPTDRLCIHLIDVLDAQCRALQKLQAPNGFWRTLLNVSEEEGSYLESSTTAGFAYGVLKAVIKRYISHGFEDMPVMAIKAVIAKINIEGELLDTSFGTRMGHDFATLQGYCKN